MADKRNDQETETKKPLTLSKKISLKDLEEARAGRSSGRGGRTVVVEVKKSRGGDGDAKKTPDARGSGLRASKPNLSTSDKRKSVHGEGDIQVAEATLSASQEDRAARLKALEEATKFVQQQAAQFSESSKKSAELRQLEEEKRKEREALLAEDAAEKEKAAQAAEAAAQATQHTSELDTSLQEGGGSIHTAKRFEKPHDDAEAAKPVAPTKRQGERRISKITVAAVLADEDGTGNYQHNRTRSLTSLRRAREKERMKLQRSGMSTEKIVREVVIPEVITVQELANRMAEKGSAVIKVLIKMGTMVTITQSIDADTAQLVAEEMGHKVKRVADSDIEDILKETVGGEDTLQSRPPVVTIMGHVDHGKTSLLDALRTTDVAGGESGGITQHIGAYQVTLASGKKISFIDTPGHAAFTEMRSRGANATDIVVLVVAADDGIKEQTVEAIHHAKAAGVPIIVAINKMDKPDANPDRVRQELMQHEIFVEDMGGEILSVEVSALQKRNLDKLEDAILLQAEMMDLKANPDCLARGVVVESRMEKGRGPVVTTLIQSGTLQIGSYFVAGSEWGRVRVLMDDHGQTLQTAGPSTPVEIIGFNALPAAGDVFTVTKEESTAREIAAHRAHKKKEKKAAFLDKRKMENLFNQNGDLKELNVLIKADVQGSVEAISSSLLKLATDEVTVRVLHSGVGEVNETDVSLANASNALILAFGVKANVQARDLAQRESIPMKHYSIIYDIINDVRDMMSGLLSPTINEKYTGRAEVRRIFKISRLGHVAGCYVSDGSIKKSGKVKLLRNGAEIFVGKIKTLKRTTDEAKEIKQGFECGILLEGFNDILEGDVIECWEIEKIARTL